MSRGHDLLGALPTGPGEVETRVWAPSARRVELVVGGRRHLLDRVAGGYHAGCVPARVGEDYGLALDGEAPRPDPCSRSQPAGLDGPSRIVDPAAFRWTDDGFALEREALVLYELHVGTFTAEGTFDAVIPELARLRRLGVTAIELMPVATFAGRRGWGYDGILLSAPHVAYGGPEGLRRLVDAAHAEGLGVVLDVVYNHLGPGGERLARFGPYFAAKATPWGPRPRFGERAVRDWAIGNALMWAREFHVDGLRVDAVWEIRDRSRTHLVAELIDRLRADAGRPLTVMLEGDPDDRRHRGDRLAWGADAWWADAFHHALHAASTGERHGYYRPFGSVAAVADAFRRDPFPPVVVCAQNHDQVGNRPAGDRLAGQKALLAAACVAFAPFVPLLFMGEERGERQPFLYFTDHTDPCLATVATLGRRALHRAAGGAIEDSPDPQARSTFARSRLSPDGDERIEELYRQLYALRPRLAPGPVRTVHDERARWLRVDRGGVSLCAAFAEAGATVPLPAGAGASPALVVATGAAALAGDAVRLGPWSAAVVRS